MEVLRILLADDHLLFRKGLARLLDAQPDFQVVGEAKNGLEAVEQARQLQPDLVLMDIRMPDCDGIEATRRIKMQQPDVRVVMLTISDDAQDLAMSVAVGAEGYLLKDVVPEALFRHLRGLMSGEAPLSQSMTGKLLRQLAQVSQPIVWSAVPSQASASLSPREREVLALVAHGLRNREIAEKLGIALNTVKNHLRSILAKLGARNRAHAAAYAVSLGLASTDVDEEVAVELHAE
jgi:DNA-binding NarL/FixJ family response regulator